jgi:hypothetical protein
MTENKLKIVFFGLVMVFSFFARLLPHAPNFAPIGALAVLAGTYLPKKYALLLPLVLMLATDYFIGFYNIKIMLSVYLSFMLYVLLGNALGKDKKIGKLSLSAFLGALLFFLITNFAVWAFSPWYSKDLSGLLLSYTLALPFFKNTLLGDLFYTATFFLVFAASSAVISRLASLPRGSAYEFALKKILLRKPILPPAFRIGIITKP